jgi:hypothetical protein
MSQKQAVDPPNHYSPQQPQPTTNQDTIVIDNETRFVQRWMEMTQKYLHQCVTIESERWLGSLDHFQQNLHASIQKSHGIEIDPSKSSFHNAVQIFNSTKINQRTLPIPSNMAFHDLTPNKSAPSEAKALLGIGGKFIFTPTFTTGDISLPLHRLLRDLCIKVIFSEEDDNLTSTQFNLHLHVRST